MKRPDLIVVGADDDDEPEVAVLIAQAIAEERRLEGLPDWPRVLGWSRHPDGVLVESNGTHWLIGHNDTAGVQRLAGLIRMEFVAGCAGSC
ncbi:MAG TPA: hypothetical protein VEQ62_18000 [Stellaceae bacterium]|jgi:hypothetical protein|nr:hypothetical protein [Stellaceae bacterium]